jgi:YHS domain-containing protein
MKQTSIFIALVFCIAACGDNTTTETHALEKPAADTVVKAKPFAAVVFTSQKDPVCKMPVRAGIEDTAHYKGGVYGFCAAECKEEFLKDPELYLKDEKKKEMK